MVLAVEADPTPLHVDQYGVVRVVGSRITLDTVVHAFENGASAEEIVLSFPTLSLADVYGVISYYLHHKANVRAYLEQREAEAWELRQRIEANQDMSGIRERLLARRAAMQS